MPLTTLDPNTALIVIDLQKGLVNGSFIHPIGEVIDRTRALIDVFRAKNLPLMLVNVAGRAPGRTEQPRQTSPRPEGWTDLTPELLRRSRARAAELGLTLDYREANAQALPFGDNEFDVVMSAIGVMFAPDHQCAAGELVRVCRPGGTIGLISWTPEGFIGQMFATMKPYVAAPPAGVQPPPKWGCEDYVRGLLGDGITDFTAQHRALRVDRFADGAAFRDFFKTYYGPTISAYRGIAGEPDRAAALDAELAELGDRYLAGSSTMEWEYLLVTARKR